MFYYFFIIIFLEIEFEVIEDSSIPVIAAVHGFTLGSGLEIALAAHYRVAHTQTMYVDC